jgi:hypothetical protein
MNLRANRSETLLLAALVLLLFALAGDVWMQRRALPQGLRYVPLDSEVWIASGALRPLWEGMRPHLSNYFADDGPETTMRSVATDLRKQLETARIELRSPDDLKALGIDAGAGVVFVHRRSPRAATLFVLPVLDRARLIDALERWYGVKAKPAPQTGAAASTLALGDMLLGFGDDGSALLTDDAALLAESLAQQGEQLDRHRSVDRVARSTEALQPGGATAAWLQGRVQGLPLVGDVRLRIEPHPRALRLRGTILVHVGRSAALARLMAPTPSPGDLGDAALHRSDLAVSVGDASLADLLRLLAGDAAARRLSGIDESFPGLLPQLQRARTLERVSAAVIDTGQSVPGVAIGLQLSERDADAVVIGMQSALRIKRDREILAAVKARKLLPDDAAEVLRAANLTTASEPLWARYRGPVARAEPKPPLSASDFAGPDYLHTGVDGGVLRDLMPPFTDDDLAWRLEGQDTGKLRIDDLRAGRFRVSSAYRDGTLWVATDVIELERWLARLRAPLAGGEFADAAAGVNGSDAAKLLAVTLPQALNAAASLHPQPEVREQRLKWLGDLTGFRSVLLSVVNGTERGEMHVDAQFLRP